MSAGQSASAGQRRPQPDDLQPFLELVSEGKSLREACRTLGLHPPSMHTWLDEDEGRREQYTRAKELRAEHFQEEALTVAKAAALGLQVGAKKVDAQGARVYLDAIKWAAGRMAPKSIPVQRIDLTARTRSMTDEEIAAEIAALEGKPSSDDG